MPAINPAINPNASAYQSLSSVNGSQAAEQQTRSQDRLNPASKPQVDTASFSSQALDALSLSQSASPTTTVNGVARSESSDSQSVTTGQTSPEVAARIRQYQANQSASDALSSATDPSTASRSRVDDLTGISSNDRPAGA